ncbi:MAG: hypothetical protein ACRD0Q_08115 [Acidimicrobiales bacterium]
MTRLLTSMWLGFITRRDAWLRSLPGPESGQVVNEWLGLSALAIVAIVAIGGALRLLGLDVIEWIRTQLIP